MRLSAERLEFGDGKSTAGRYARSVKANAQAVSSPDLEAIETKVMRKLAANPVFQSAARPRAMSKLIVSRYRIGQTYGLHVDDALMSGVRTDLSFTLFLSEPDEYDGGALIIEETSEEWAFRPAAGDLRPSSLHDAAQGGAGDSRGTLCGCGLGTELDQECGEARDPL